MFRAKYLTLVLTALLFSVSAYSQGAPVRGEVKLQKPDGTTVPVMGAIVEAFRTDVDKGKMPEAKTNKRGEFTFVSFPYGQKYVLSVSGPGIGPKIQPEIKAGNESVVFIVNEGDGRRLTEAEVRAAAKGEAAAAAQGGGGGGETEEQKKARAELEKKNAEINAANQKIQAGDETARKAAAEGRAALEAKNWDVAIAKFNEGVAAVPDFVGSTPILLAGKMLAHKGKGFDLYIAGAKVSDPTARLAKYGEAKKEYNDGLAAYAQAVDIVKKAGPATDPREQAQRKSLMTDLYGAAIEIHRLMAVGQVDTSRAAEAEVIIKESIADETDPAKKAKAQTILGDIMRASGEFDKAVAAYKSVLETTPENNEVKASLGLSLVAQGTSVDPPNREQLQEGLNYMQQYADTVAILPTDPPTVQEFKKSVKETVEYLKNEQKLKAQPVKATGGGRKKG